MMEKKRKKLIKRLKFKKNVPFPFLSSNSLICFRRKRKRRKTRKKRKTRRRKAKVKRRSKFLLDYLKDIYM